MTRPTIASLGDGALVIRLGDTVDPTLVARVGALSTRIRHAHLDGVLELVPAYTSLAVFFDVRDVTHDALARALAPILGDAPVPPIPIDAADSSDPIGNATVSSGPIHQIPVHYDGPDLPEVARLTGLTIDEVVARHAARTYTVYFLGFAPGFAYLGELDPSLVIPRRAEPRRRVPAGSVAIAAAQTAVYPLDTPGGWHLLGHTPTVMFDPSADPPALLAPGDRVRFVPLT